MKTLDHITCIEDLRRHAARRVPRMFYDYVDSGSWSESSYRHNEQAFSSYKFLQRVAVNTAGRSTATTMLESPVVMPVALAPAGLAGMQWPDGEILAARAAAAFGVPFTLSTMSICSIEDVAAATGRPFWFQLYLLRDREFVLRLMARARDAGCPVLMLTLDVPVPAQRHADVRNRLSVPPRPNLRNLWRLAMRPRWCLAMAGTNRRGFGNIIGHARDVADLSSFWSWSARQFEANLTWDDVVWVRRHWQGKLVLKGIMAAADARMALAVGADAIVVSNHGGRQLDGAPATIDVLASIADAVGHRTEIHLDSGVRSGQDVLRARALGARGVYIGRPYLYGLGAGGEAGVLHCLHLIHGELDKSMALCGIRHLGEVGRTLLV